MEWISTKDYLPEEGKYVFAKHNIGTWRDSTDQENVNCVVVKLVRGISMAERKLMEDGKLPSEKVGGIHFDGSFDKPIHSSTDRWRVYRSEDEQGNNLTPYEWKTFGATSFFGQDISHWMPIPKCNNID
jgi:hypothetical protein